MKKSMIVILAVFFLASCGGKRPKTETVYLSELGVQPPLRAEQRNQNREVIKNYKKKSLVLTKIAIEDKREQKKLEKKQREIARKSKELESQLLKKTGVDELIAAQGNKKVEELLSLGLTPEEFEKRLKSETRLSAMEIKKLVKGYRLKQMIANAKSKEQLTEVLQKNTDLDATEIQQVVTMQQRLTDKKAELRKETLKKIHARLLRNRKLNIESVFCSGASKLDQILIRPVFYPFDVHVVNKKSSNFLFEDITLIQKEIGLYPDMMLQLEGNCDYKGSNRYNKALGDRRWSGVEPLLSSLGFNESSLRGISKGEECSTVRKDDDGIWRAENRRTDFVWALKQPGLSCDNNRI